MEEEIESVFHKHPLILLDNEENSEKICGMCDLPILGPIYGCSQCKNQFVFVVHKSCAELPPQIQHPFHSKHPLTRYFENPYDWGPVICSACTMSCSSFNFHCADCQFYLGVRCTSLEPSVWYQGHPHPLAFFEKSYRDLEGEGFFFRCVECNYESRYNPLDDDFRLDDFPLRCVECDFNLHLHCHPSLPLTIKHECHIDPLTLTPSVVQEDNYSNEFYCDACEKKRNPKNPVYYCAECDFAAHIGCVISEVLPSLIAEQEGHRRVNVADSLLANLDKEIARLRLDIEAKTKEIDAETKMLEAKKESLEAEKTKLEELEGKRAQCVASEMLQGTVLE